MKRTGKGKASLKRARAEISQHNAQVARPRRAVGVNSSSVFQAPARKETKFLDFTSTACIVAGAATSQLIGPCNAIAQGTDAIQHVGREVTLTSIYWQLEASLAATTAGSSPVRMVLVYDKDANGAAPTVATGAVTDIFAADQLNAPMNLNNRDRFIILSDEIIECLGTAGPQAIYRKGYRKVSLPMVFNATATATITAIQTGSIYAVFWQNGNLITANPTNSLWVRTRFTDA